jgi:transposase-like protein
MSKRRQHSIETKLKVVKEVLETGNATLVARRHDLSPSMVSKWVRQYKQYGEAAFKGNNKGNGHLVKYTDKDYRKLEDENERLKKILGEKDLEVEILRDLLKKQTPHWPTK